MIVLFISNLVNYRS